MSRSPLLLAVLLASLVLSASGGAASKTVHPLLGIRGDSPRFQGLTAQDSTVIHQIVGWGQGDSWGTPLATLLGQMGQVPLLALNTTAKWPSRAEAITPAQIAAGVGDGYLLAINRAVNGFGKTMYLRPFGEMNGYWNKYCAYTKTGHAKAGHSTASFRQAFARVYLIAHGGSLAEINAALAARKMAPVRGAQGDLPENPYPTLRVIWNPQGFGAPDIRGNSAQAYYPGDAFADVVGDDLYDIGTKAEWPAADALYKAHPSKPFAFPEWGLWGIDDPAFIRKMRDFVKTHPRTEMLAYFDSKPGSIFDLASKPLSKAAYRAAITPLG
ncbi:MAG: hypothetical protein QOE29_871 [Gaiellaceae bacterium]|nr:hypothetical protein [Gaiellaceae bacterium]